jgi:hypothetical protein
MSNRGGVEPKEEGDKKKIEKKKASLQSKRFAVRLTNIN